MQALFKCARGRGHQIGRLAAIILALAVTTVALDASGSETKTFSELLAARRDVTERELDEALISSHAPMRQYAVMKLAESATDSADAVRKTIEMLADTSLPVRYQALAALMRRTGTAPEAMLSALTDFRNVRQHQYFSEAQNGARQLPTTTSSLIFTALYHAGMDITDDLLARYEREFPGRDIQDDFLHPDYSEVRLWRRHGRTVDEDEKTLHRLRSNLEREIAAAHTPGSSTAVPSELQQILDVLGGKPLPTSPRGSADNAPRDRATYHAAAAEALAELRQTSGSKGAVRQRLLDAIRYLSRHASPHLAAATLNPDGHLRAAALDAVRINKLSSPEILVALEQGLVKGDEPFRTRAAGLLAARGDEGRARLRSLLAHKSAVVRGVALANYPDDALELVTHVNNFLASANPIERMAALQRLASAASSCRQAGTQPDGRSSMFSGLTQQSRAALMHVLERSADPSELQLAIRAVSSATCDDLPARARAANQLAVTLPRASSERLDQLASMLDQWIGEGPFIGKDLPSPLIGKAPAKRAVAAAMARAATTKADYRSVSDLVRVFISLKLSLGEARSLIPKAAKPMLAGEIGYWLGRSKIADAMKRHGVGEAFAEYVAERAPTHGPTASDIYMALAPLAPTSKQFRDWQRKLLEHADRSLVERVAVDIAKRDGADRTLFARLVSSVRTAKVLWRLDSPAFNHLLTMGPRGATALIGLMSDADIPEEKRAALLKAAALGAATNAGVREFLLQQARSATPADRYAAALEAIAYLKAAPPEELSAIWLAAMGSTERTVRLSAVHAWRRKGLTADAMFALAFADPDPEVQAAALALLKYLDVEPVRKLEVVRKALELPQEVIRDAAFDVIETMGDGAVPLLNELSSRPGDPPPRFFRAVQRLDKLPAELKSALLKRADEPGTPSASAALEALEHFREARLGKPNSLSADEIASLRRNLRSGELEHRARAATQLVTSSVADPWADGGLIAAVLMEASVRQIVLERLGATLDLLHPPGFTFVSGRGSGLAVFPWPPPVGYSTYSIPRSLFNQGGATTFGELYRSLVGSLGAVSDNFEHGLFTGPPDGFAVVARLERVKSDGTPLPEPARWVKAGRPTLNLFDLLGDLFLSQPGYFRTIVFAVTSDLQPGSDSARHLPEPGAGAPDMPAELAVKPLGNDLYVLALVYSFERKSGGQIQPWRDGAPSAQGHLSRAGVLNQLEVYRIK